jgi:hypothetical protein
MTTENHTETYSMPEGGWVCFHCGEHLKTVGAAQDHFGGTPDALAGCQIKAGEERGLLMELRKAEADRDEWMSRALRNQVEIEALELKVGSLTTAMQSYAPFRKCRSINDVFFLFDSVEGRAIAAETQLRQLREEQ